MPQPQQLNASASYTHALVQKLLERIIVFLSSSTHCHYFPFIEPTHEMMFHFAQAHFLAVAARANDKSYGYIVWKSDKHIKHLQPSHNECPTSKMHQHIHCNTASCVFVVEDKIAWPLSLCLCVHSLTASIRNECKSSATQTLLKKVSSGKKTKSANYMMQLLSCSELVKMRRTQNLQIKIQIRNIVVVDGGGGSSSGHIFCAHIFPLSNDSARRNRQRWCWWKKKHFHQQHMARNFDGNFFSAIFFRLHPNHLRLFHII